MSNSKDDINEAILRKMFSIIRLEEANNLKTGKLNDSQMVLRIANIINKILEGANKNEV